MALNGKIKIIKDGGDGIIMTKDGSEIPFQQRYYKSLCLNDGDAIRYEVANVDGKAFAVNVLRKTVGTVASINEDGISGFITEKELNPKRFGADGKSVPLPFYQPFLKSLGIAEGDMVHYDLVLTDKGETIAVNVEEN